VQVSESKRERDGDRVCMREQESTRKIILTNLNQLSLFVDGALAHQMFNE